MEIYPVTVKLVELLMRMLVKLINIFKKKKEIRIMKAESRVFCCFSPLTMFMYIVEKYFNLERVN